MSRYGFLEASGVREDVTRMLTVSGWERLLQLSWPCDREDTAEFLVTLNFSDACDHQVISYRFRGEPMTCTIAEVRQIFGWGDDGHFYNPWQGDWSRAWRVLAPSTYYGGNTSSRHIMNPARFYLHVILSKTIFARKNMDKI